MIWFLVIIAVIVGGLAAPSAVIEKSWERFIINALISTFGIVLPLGVFFLSSLLVPDWKGGCLHGSIDCFHTGKIALTPLVVWAISALYRVEVMGVERPVSRQVVLGLWTGASIAAICFLFGLFLTSRDIGVMSLCLVVPFYTAIWYGGRALDLSDETQITSKPAVVTVLASSPFWIGSMLWSQAVYDSLPNQAPSCFVVTAAGRGHAQVVGPFMAVPRHGRTFLANQQLVTLWQFEALWRAQAPASHAVFRRIYNRVGPLLARRITSLWVADAVFLSLKPVEWIGSIVVKTFTSSAKSNL